MRIFSLLCFLIFFSCGSTKEVAKVIPPSPQSIYEAEIKKKLNIYFDKMVAGDIEGSLDLIYPKLFDIIPKVTMVGMLKQAFEDEEMEMSFGGNEILKIYDNYIEVDDKIHTLVDYNFIMNMELKGEMAEAADFMRPSFEEEYEKENVTYNKEKNTFTINTKNQMVAIKENGEWYFLENKNEPAYKFILDKLLGTETIEKLGIK